MQPLRPAEAHVRPSTRKLAEKRSTIESVPRKCLRKPCLDYLLPCLYCPMDVLLSYGSQIDADESLSTSSHRLQDFAQTLLLPLYRVSARFLNSKVFAVTTSGTIYSNLLGAKAIFERPAHFVHFAHFVDLFPSLLHHAIVNNT